MKSVGANALQALDLLRGAEVQAVAATENAKDVAIDSQDSPVVEWPAFNPLHFRPRAVRKLSIHDEARRSGAVCVAYYFYRFTGGAVLPSGARSESAGW